MICATCPRVGCVNEPTELSPIVAQCHACHGKPEGCTTCGETGRIKITGCPKRQITHDVVLALDAADFARKGCLPIAGGMLNQTHIGMRAIRTIWAEEAAHGRTE